MKYGIYNHYAEEFWTGAGPDGNLPMLFDTKAEAWAYLRSERLKIDIDDREGDVMECRGYSK